MKDPELKQLNLLGLSHELDLLQTLDNRLSKSYPQSWFTKADSFHTAAQYLASFTYDLVIVDISMIGGYKLIVRALAHKFPVLVLVDKHKELSPKEHSISLKAQAVLPKNIINAIDIVDFIEKNIRPGTNLKWSRTSNWSLILKNLIFASKRKRMNEWLTMNKKIVTLFLTLIFIVLFCAYFYVDRISTNDMDKKKFYEIIVVKAIKNHNKSARISIAPFTELEEFYKKSTPLSDRSRSSKSNYLRQNKEQLVDEMMKTNIGFYPQKALYFLDKKYRDHKSLINQRAEAIAD